MAALDPVSIIETVIRMANDGDVTAMMSFFAEGAVIRLEPPLPPPLRPVYRGKDEIAEYVQRIVHCCFHVDPGNFQSTANGVTWDATVCSDFFQQLGIDETHTTSHAVVQGDLLQSLTIHYEPEFVRKLQAATAGAAQPS